jgi:hypothetical protein
MYDCVSASRNMIESEGKGRGMDRKTSKECMTDDVRKLRLRKEDAQDRTVRRSGILGMA